MPGKRLNSGGLIDRENRICFYFNGKRLWGYGGDTLASALLANGIRLTARSFKYHRPRGIVGHGVEEPASIVELEGEEASGNQPITTVILKDGLRARSVNCWPSPEFDFGSINQIFSKLLPAGFYYKTFKWPNWHLYEPSIRKAAGLANLPLESAENKRFENRFAFADLLVVGAGPSGIKAALDAARQAKRVILADAQTQAGGSLLGQRLFIKSQAALEWVRNAIKELSERDNVIHLQNTTVWAYREHNFIMANQRQPNSTNIFQRNWRIRAGKVIIATGAVERGLVFSDNDRPGIMLASSIQTYINRYAVSPGSNISLFTNNNSAYAVGADLMAAGINLEAIIDSRNYIPKEAEDMVSGASIFKGYTISQVIGRKSLKGIEISNIDEGSTHRIVCDALGQSGGWSPTVHLWSQSRGTLLYNKKLGAFLPAKPAQNCEVIGAATGKFSLCDTIRGSNDLPYAIEQNWETERIKTKSTAFVDIQNDVTVADLQLALREGYTHVEQVKRYTTAGMGIDQGKTGNINIIGILASEKGIEMEEVGTTTFRAPYAPVSFGAIGGTREDTVVFPYRHTPITSWALEKGAFMYEAGARWRRPGYFPEQGEDFQEAVNRECKAVRERVGVYDGSPLGTFELKGRDVPEFLDFIYTNMMSNLKPGQARYGLMLSDDGLIIDDGVVLRLSEFSWILSTATGHADAINQHMEKLLQTEFPSWEVMITVVTSQWNNATLCGPKSRKVMKALGTDIDLSNENFPFMSFREGIVAELPARVVRVSFTGELSFEINVAPRYMKMLWQKILTAGTKFKILPVGSEASHVLRVEKGFLSLGHEIDGTTDPFDLGMGWIMSKRKSDFLGKRSIEIRRAGSEVRRELVGILPKDPKEQVPEGAPMTPQGKKQKTEGLVTACVWSVVFERWVGLALLEKGHSRHGQTGHIRLKDKVIEVEITPPIFHDPHGKLLRS